MHRAIKWSIGFVTFSLLTLTQMSVAQTQLHSPQIGTWAIIEEINGKPGRGFQIDVQNDILVLYFYGYENTGESTYWLAAGRIPDGTNQLTADLGEYQGGMAFGDPLKEAVYVASRGQVTIRFSSIRRGEICLPGEPCKAIKAFNFGFEENASELVGAWLVTNSDPEDREYLAYELRFFALEEINGPNFIRGRIRLTFAELDGDGHVIETDIRCVRQTNPQPWMYTCDATPASGQLPIELNFTVQRNALVGESHNTLGTEGAGSLWGFRVMNRSGRVVLPN